MVSLEKIGRLLFGFGSLGMVGFACLFIIRNILTEINQTAIFDLHAFNMTLTASILGAKGWKLSSIITLISGFIGIKGYTDLANFQQKKDRLFTWGVFGIVLGIVGGTVGGGMILIAGVLLMISYFLE